jgi:excisionase family DNA binding protein
MRKLISIKKLADETEIPIRTLRSFVTSRKIPFLKIGHRTILFDRSKVEAALSRFEIQEVGAAK